jgi:hypothetical protein
MRCRRARSPMFVGFLSWTCALRSSGVSEWVSWPPLLLTSGLHSWICTSPPTAARGALVRQAGRATPPAVTRVTTAGLVSHALDLVDLQTAVCELLHMHCRGCGCHLRPCRERSVPTALQNCFQHGQSKHARHHPRQHRESHFTIVWIAMSCGVSRITDVASSFGCDFALSNGEHAYDSQHVSCVCAILALSVTVASVAVLVFRRLSSSDDVTARPT